MTPLQIIRIEHNDGIGIFNTNSGNSIYDIPKLNKLCERHFCGIDYCTSTPFPRPEEDNCDFV